MGPDAPEMLTLVATPRAAALLVHRDDLGLVERREGEGAEAGGNLVLLATSADDLSTVSSETIRICVLEESLAGAATDRFTDYVFPTATLSEIAFRASLGLKRHRRTRSGLPAGGLDPGSGTVPLSALEERLMTRLRSAGGAPVSRADLERVIADTDTGASVRGRALDAHIYRLRRKLRDVADIRIDTVRQRGFALSSERVTATSMVAGNGGS